MSVLDKICAQKQAHIRVIKQETPLHVLEAKIQNMPPTRGFIKEIINPENAPALIAEIKKASPAKGLIRPDFDPAGHARAYQTGGAACLSVLTDTPFFQGHDRDLINARAACTLPCLRKDFMLDEYQIYQSRALGADCILLIMAALSDEQAAALYRLARKLGLDVLVEIHDQAELTRALALEPAMIGVNSRNLKTLQVDLATARALAPHIPDGIVKIAESGISGYDDMVSLTGCGYQGFLVGESLMRHADIAAATMALRGKNSGAS